MYVKKCGGCDQLFEVEGGHQPDMLRKPEGLMRTASIDLCPICRDAAQQRGQPVLPEIPPGAGVAREEQEEAPDGAR